MRKVCHTVKSYVLDFRKTHQNKIYLSFGENCLTDNILERHGIKSFSTPYSSARSNIEYILQIERDHFRCFLNPADLYYDYIGNKRVVRLKKYTNIQNTYKSAHMKGFEFTDHDVLGNKEIKEKFEHRTSRMLNLKNRNLCIFYHSRLSQKTDTELLIKHLCELKEMYEKRCKNVNVIAFSQVIVDNPQQRKIEVDKKSGIYMYRFYVLKEWSGDDQDVFWAKCDDDLIAEMIRDVQKL